MTSKSVRFDTNITDKKECSTDVISKNDDNARHDSIIHESRTSNNEYLDDAEQKENESVQKTFLGGESDFQSNLADDDSKIDETDFSKSFLSTISEHATEEEDGDEIVRGRRQLYLLRISMMLVIFTIAAVIMSIFYTVMNKSQYDTFREKFNSASMELKGECQRNIDLNLYASYTLAFTYLSLNKDANKDWPNVTLVDLDSYAESLCATTKCRTIAFAPIVYNQTRLAWEQYAAEHAYLLGSPSLVHRTDNNSWIVSDGIFQFKNGQRIYDPGYDPASSFPDILTPLWQVYPIQGNEDAVMLNTKPYSPRTFEDLLTYRIPVLTPTIQLVQDIEPRPSSVLYFPILDHFPITEANASNSFLGFVSFAFSWDVVLSNVLSKDTAGLICVLRASSGEVSTFEINEGNAIFVADGDSHDPKYDSLDYVPYVYNVSLGANWEQLAEVDSLVTFSIYMYPSNAFKNKYVTDRPKKVLIGVSVVFIFTAAMFLVYDILLHQRLKSLKTSVARSNTVVNSLFPHVVRDRLLKMNHESKTTMNNNNNNTATITQKKKKKSTMSNMLNQSTANKITNFITLGSAALSENNSQSIGKVDAGGTAAGQNMKIDSEPIADMFPSTTIMFADIAGFTSWSSAHTPQHVFRLLEKLFKEFDRASKKLGVFKVETIGDCYVAVCGLPTPRDDHAVVMSQFALVCQRKFNQVINSLVDIDADILRLRSGLHSGPITGGILRGEKSRFQLFGDTMNIAAKMESSGTPTKVQISEQTAELLTNAGKNSWFIPREDLVTFKGQEDADALQTYWLIPNVHIKDMRANSEHKSKSDT